MKVIFLDFDGVLNSVRYDRERAPGDTNNIDVTRLPLLKEIVDRTGAKIVLSTSWRIYWDRDESLCEPIGREINELFAQYGLSIFDKTITISSSDRDQEVREWMVAHYREVEAFVILDDIASGWDDLLPHLVRTHPRIGRGLEREHVERAIALLTE